jgi:hypothetical protein
MAVVGGVVVVVVWIVYFRNVMSKSTRSYDHSPDQMFGTGIPVHTHNTVETGTVLPGFSKLEPVPIPMHTHDTLSWVYLLIILDQETHTKHLTRASYSITWVRGR